MLLTDVRNYIAETGKVSRTQIANRFEIEPEAVGGMLDALISRGDVKLNAEHNGAQGGCKCDKGCGCCSTANAFIEDVYEWIGRARSSRASGA